MKIELLNINKKYINGDLKIEIFNSLNLTINNNNIISIVGPNGCGKSTLLNIIAGIDRSFDGKILADIKYKTSYMFQKDLLIPWRNSFDNAIIGIELANKISNENIKNAKYLFKQFNIYSKLNSYPSTLSGGERQKVALIRTMLPDSDLILFDEPFASIDYQSKMQLYDWFYNYFKQKKKTVLIVTHDIEEAINLGDKVIIFNNKPNGIYKIIDINITDKERNPIILRKNPLFTDYFSKIWSYINEMKNNEI